MKTKQDKLAFIQEQLIDVQNKQFRDFDFKHQKSLDELILIRSTMEGDSYRELSTTNQRISKESTRLDMLVKDVNKMNIEQRGVISNMNNDIQNRLVTMEKRVGNELKQNY